MGGTLVIVGESVRAAARSAALAGYTPWCIDLRGDRDLREAVAGVHVCAREAFPAGLIKLVELSPPGAPVLVTAPLENHPEVIRAVAFQRPILGSSADAIAAARQPAAIPSLKPLRGIGYPRAGNRLSLARRLGQLVFGGFVRAKYLLKPRRSTHGLGIDWWGAHGRIDDAHYLQQYIRGEPYTAVFTGDGWSAMLLGVTEQIVGDPAFGAASMFHGLGDIGPVKLTEESRAALSRLAVQVSQKYDVRGLFGIDFIMDPGGKLWPVEINPRYPAATEVLERADGVPALLGTGASVRSKAAGGVLVGRACVMAQSDITAPDVYTAAPKENLLDIPPVGAPIPRGAPICSVVASAWGREAVLTRLRELAASVYAAVR